MAQQQSKTTEQVTTPPNPTGKGGFGDHPENRNPGGWKKEMVFSYQYRRFMNMTVEELREYSKKDDKDRTVVEDLAYARVIAARKSLPDVKEITDRTEGKAPQSIDMTSNGESINPYGNLTAEELRKLAGK
jgi:hypothetical protein